MASGAGTSLEEEVAELVRSAASAPLPVVDLDVQGAPGAPVVRGRVLTLRQAGEVRRLAAAHNAGVEIEVLADPDLGLEEAWLEVTDEPLELWRGPDLIGMDGARQTEYLVADGPLRLLGRSSAMALVQGPDLTLGWVVEALLKPASPGAAKARWAAWRRAPDGDTVPPADAADGAIDRLMAYARDQLDAPYRWGGTTPRGFDCSGLVQRAFSRATGVLLPKHTADQRHTGVRVVAGDARAGDLLFATPRSRRVGHVLLLTSPTSVIHACLTEKRVIEEPLAENALRYQHRGYRRPVVFGS